MQVNGSGIQQNKCCESIKSVEVSTNPDQTHLNHQTKEDYLKITGRCRFVTELRRIMQDHVYLWIKELNNQNGHFLLIS